MAVMSMRAQGQYTSSGVPGLSTQLPLHTLNCFLPPSRGSWVTSQVCFLTTCLVLKIFWNTHHSLVLTRIFSSHPQLEFFSQEPVFWVNVLVCYYYHIKISQTEGPEQEFIFHRFGGWKSKIKLPSGSVSFCCLCPLLVDDNLLIVSSLLCVYVYMSLMSLYICSSSLQIRVLVRED